jgi:hypothetical protein
MIGTINLKKAKNMNNVDLLGIKSVSLTEVFEASPEPPKDLLCTLEHQGDKLEAMNNSLTLVLDRDIHRSIEHSSAIAVHLSKKFPLRNTLLINTYAGAELMRASLIQGMMDADVLLPSSWKYRAVIANKNAKFSESPDVVLPPNLRVLNCPYSTLTTALIDSEIAAHKCDIVILNSFEFASLSSYAKSLLAQGLVSLRVNRKLSMVVYSQDRHKGLSTYSLGRGPIGSIAPFSGAIWRIFG